MKTVYQTNDDGLFLYEATANELPLSPGKFNIPFGAYSDAPPKALPGMAARRTGTRWVLVEDHRNSTLWEAETGQRYTPGTNVSVNGANASYPGWGPLPAWLTNSKPEATPGEPIDGVAMA